VDLSTLEPLFGFPGPYATAYFDATRAEESGAREIALRWHRLRAELARQGAPDPLLDEREAAALANDHYPGRHGRIVVGTGKEVVLDEALPHPPERESAAWVPLPHLLPYVRQHAAVEGLPEVVDAVRRAQADTVLLRDDPSATTRLWVGPEPLHLGLAAADLQALGVPNPEQDRADAAIVRALAATRGGLMPASAGMGTGGTGSIAGLRDGIGALLRYADAATPSG
jgi:hypothetical protein